MGTSKHNSAGSTDKVRATTLPSAETTDEIDPDNGRNDQADRGPKERDKLDTHTYARGYDDKSKHRKSKRRRRGRKCTIKDRKQKTGEEGHLKIAYANVQGRLGRTKAERWQEMRDLIHAEKWDIVLLTETHWRGRRQGCNVTTYKSISQARQPQDKKGGGLMVIYKDSLEMREWKRSATREGEIDQEVWKADIMWVHTKLDDKKLGAL